MSTATATATPSTARTFARPGFGRLTMVELRKMTDTRAGFWLLASVAALTVLVVVILGLAGNADDHQLRDMLSIAVQPASVLLPVVGILLVSSEWSQRTALITFSLVPKRLRVIAAKLGATVVISLVALVISLVIAVVGTAVAASGVDHVWSLPVGLLVQVAVYVMTAMIMGVAFGAVFLSSAPAIVLYFVLPTAWAALGQISALEGAARWLDGSRSLSPMTEHIMSATEWARAGTTLALWMLLPLLIGLWRIARSEVR
jgi:ABC-type transport system involved in multi-copper enzyme maturation permease subunit